MKLYGCKGCGSAVVEVLLQMANNEYEFVDAIRWEPFERHDELEQLNPLGQVPVLLLDDGTVMTESAAISIFLAEKVPGLIPTGLKQRAEFFRWMIFIPANMYALYQFRDFPARWLNGPEAQAEFRQKTEARLREYWEVLESRLNPAPYVLGDTITALDIYLAMMSRWAPGRKWLEQHCPKIISAVLKTETHPVVKEVWERNFVA